MLGEVVAGLIEAVDGMFHCGDVGVGGVGGSGAVFGVPEVEVGSVLGYDGVMQGTAGCYDIEGVVVPEAGGAILEGGDLDGGEVEGFRHAAFEAMVEHH